MIKELSDALRNLIHSLAVRPLATICAVFIILAAFILYRSYDLLEHLIVTPHEESARFGNQLSSAALVNDSINYLKEDLQAHNVVIRQFHNGRHDLTGIPFTEASVTYHTEGYEGEVEEVLSLSNNSLRLMWKDIDNPECIILQKGVDISTRRYLKDNSLERMAVCPLTNPLNYPVGTITVGLSAGNTKADTVVLTKIHSVARRITGYLDDAQ